MTEAKYEDMELGNLLFGNSRGKYCVEPRKVYQDAFCKFLSANGFDFGGWRGTERGYENDVFVIRPYYWGDDEEVAALPNFVYKPAGVEIRWYKYPMRDAYSNMDISVGAFKEILRHCAWSMKEAR